MKSKKIYVSKSLLLEELEYAKDYINNLKFNKHENQIKRMNEFINKAIHKCTCNLSRNSIFGKIRTNSGCPIHG